MSAGNDDANDEAERHACERLLLAFVPWRLSDAYRCKLRARILVRAHRAAPDGTTTLRAEEGEWQGIAPGVAIKTLRIDSTAGMRTILVRMRPQSSLDGHLHTRDEECFVLEGEIFIGNHRLCRGDMHIARAGSVHARIRSPNGALLMVRAQIEIRPMLG
jgi:anti-sigma factor ChrR (cupin superfamily)